MTENTFVWLLYRVDDGQRGLWGVFSAPEKAVAALRRHLPSIQWLAPPRAIVVTKVSDDFWVLHEQFHLVRVRLDPEFRAWPWDDGGAIA